MAREIEILQPSFYKDFSCIGPACTDNCCHTWRIDVDKEHYLMYRKVRDAAFRETCAAVLKKKRKDATDAFYAVMSHPAEGKCGFQDEDGGCRIVRQLGPQALCNTCTVYPRRKVQYLPGLWELSLSLSCEEAARLAILSGKPVEFERFRRPIDEKNFMDRYAPVYASGRNFLPPPDFGQPLRQACMALMAERSHPIKERILAMGVLLRRVGCLVTEKKQEQIPAAISQLMELMKAGALTSLFQKPAYNEALHRTALALPLAHLMQVGRRPIFRHIQELLAPYCDYDQKENNYTAREETMAFLLQITKEKADPVLAELEQGVENYFTCYLFSSIFPMYHVVRGLTPEESAIMLAEQYALLRILLATLEEREGETSQQRLVRAVVALARITQHSDMGKTFHTLSGLSGLDSLAHAMYLLY